MNSRLALLLVFFLVGIFYGLTRTALGVTSQSDAPQVLLHRRVWASDAQPMRCDVSGRLLSLPRMRAGMRAARVRMQLS